jgi:hypothetical protein
MKTLGERIISYIDAADHPVTCFDLSREFGKGERLLIDSSDSHVVGWGISEEAHMAMHYLLGTLDIIPCPCDPEIYFKIMPLDEILEKCVLNFDNEDGFTIQRLQWKPVEFKTFEGTLKWIEETQEPEEAAENINRLKKERAKIVGQLE